MQAHFLFPFVGHPFMGVPLQFRPVDPKCIGVQYANGTFPEETILSREINSHEVYVGNDQTVRLMEINTKQQMPLGVSTNLHYYWMGPNGTMREGWYGGASWESPEEDGEALKEVHERIRQDYA